MVRLQEEQLRRTLEGNVDKESTKLKLDRAIHLKDEAKSAYFTHISTHRCGIARENTNDTTTFIKTHE